MEPLNWMAAGKLDGVKTRLLWVLVTIELYMENIPTQGSGERPEMPS